MIFVLTSGGLHSGEIPEPKSPEMGMGTSPTLPHTPELAPLNRKPSPQGQFGGLTVPSHTFSSPQAEAGKKKAPSPCAVFILTWMKQQAALLGESPLPIMSLPQHSAVGHCLTELGG